MGRERYYQPEMFCHWDWIRTVGYPAGLRDSVWLAIERKCQKWGEKPKAINEFIVTARLSMITCSLGDGIKILKEAETRNQKERVRSLVLKEAAELSERKYYLPLSGLFVVSPMLLDRHPPGMAELQFSLDSYSRLISLIKTTEGETTADWERQYVDNARRMFEEFCKKAPPIAARQNGF